MIGKFMPSGSEGSDEALLEAIETVVAAREGLERAVMILRGHRVDSSTRAMRIEQQVTRALGALWGIDP